MEKEGRHYAITLEKPGAQETYICPSVTTIGEGFTNNANVLMRWVKKVMSEFLLDRLKYDYPITVNALKKKDTWAGSRKWEFIRSACRRYVLRSKKEDEKVSGKAKGIGSAAHDLIEKYINAKDKSIFLQDVEQKVASKEIEEPVFNSFSAFLVWEKENVSEWLETEIIVFYQGRDFKAAGRFDAIAKLKNKKIVLIDFKTSKAIYPEMIEQLGGYFVLYNFSKNKKYKASIVNVGFERTFFIPSYKIEGGIILRIDKETGKHQERRYNKTQLVKGGKIFSHGARAFAERADMKKMEEEIKAKLAAKKAKAKEKLALQKLKEKQLRKEKLLKKQKNLKKTNEVKKNGRENKNT